MKTDCGKRKRFIIAFLMIMTLWMLPSYIFADEPETSGECGVNVTWSFDRSTGHLVISGQGRMTDWKLSGSRNYYEDRYGTYPATTPARPWAAFSEEIQTVTISSGVMNVGDAAFYSCRNLKSVSIPETVTSIGHHSFENCSTLANVVIPDRVAYLGTESFRSCSSLKEIRVPEGVRQIPEGTFRDCVNLESMTLPDSIKGIGSNACLSCSSLNNVTLPDAVVSIGSSAFNNCSSLDAMTVPDSVTSLGAGTFAGCTNLKSIVLPGHLEVIKSSLFQGCSSLSEVEIPNGVSEIQSDAFYGCSSLTAVQIPESMTKIGDWAFLDCSALQEIEIPGRNAESIGSGCFQGCDHLKSVRLPDTVISMGFRVFSGCRSLQEMRIPNGLNVIQIESFYQCVSLKTVTIPSEITIIGENAFGGCESLKNIRFKGTAEKWNRIEIQRYNDELNQADRSYDNVKSKNIKVTYDGGYGSYDKRVIYNARYSSMHDGLQYVLEVYERELRGGGGNTGHNSTSYPIATRIGYVFDGWYTEPEGGGTRIEDDSIVEISEDHTLYAYYRPRQITVTFDTNDGTAGTMGSKGVYYERSYGELPVPVREGYDFAGWFTDADYGFRITEKTVLTSLGNRTLYAHWEKKDQSDPLPAPEPENPFTDVAKDAFYYDPVLWAVSNKVTSGTSEITFSPDSSCTRAQMVTFLWRAKGCPEPESMTHSFEDIEMDAYYTKAVLWAVEQEITNGTSSSTFSPESSVNRAQTVTFLWRMEGKQEVSEANPFHDVGTDEYYTKPVLWAVKSGITKGTSDITFSPLSPCTRGQIVTFLHRDLSKTTA